MKDKYLPLRMLLLLLCIWGLYKTLLKDPAASHQEEPPPSRFSFVQQEAQPEFEPYALPKIGPGKDAESPSPPPAAQETERFEEAPALSPEAWEPAPAPEVDTEAVMQELRSLSEHPPAVLIDCPRCEGWGKVQMDCPACGGLGQTVIPGVTAFTATVPCSECQGSGFQRCPDCTFGMVRNPDYEAQQAAWTARRRELWGQMGFTAEEIRLMEIETAQSYLEQTGGGDSYSSDFYGDDFYNGGYDGELEAPETPPGLCRICYGSGDCPTCGGDGFYPNPLTGNQISCPNCRTTQGRCWSCGGSGRAG